MSSNVNNLKEIEMSLMTFSIKAELKKATVDAERVEKELKEKLNADQVIFDNAKQKMEVLFKKECKSFSGIDHLASFRDSVAKIGGVKVTDCEIKK